MFLSYGSYIFPSNVTVPTSEVRLITSPTGRPLRYTARMMVKGYLQGAGQAQLVAQELALNAALLVPYQDLVFRQDTNAPTGMRLLEGPSISGVRIVEGPNYTNEAADGEYVIQRAFRFTAEAEYQIISAATAVVSWTETIAIVGTTGPVRSWRKMVNTGPVRQIVYPISTCRVIQSGQAVGYSTRPFAPDPLFPLYEHFDRRKFAPISPKRLGDSFIEAGIAWSYEFEADVPLVGLPSLPPA